MNKETIQRALGIIEGVAFSMDASDGRQNGLLTALAMIEEAIKDDG